MRQLDLPGPLLPRALDAPAGAHFHYRNLDVSTLKELVRRWNPELRAFSKEGKHEALADILESMEEAQVLSQDGNDD